jgi:hypothetical protein
MKKQLIAIVVTAVILFVWQFLSWALLPIHKDVYGYTPNQDKIMEALTQNLTTEGTYMMPMPPPDASPEQQQSIMEASMGKPWASVTYHRAMNMSMGMNMFRGLTVDLAVAFLLIWLLSKIENLSISTAVQASVVVGILGYLTIPYLNSIWFETGSLGHLVDAIVPWAIVGAWLGWWLNRR